MFIELESIFNTEGLAKSFSYELPLTDTLPDGSCPFKTPVLVEGKVQNNTGIVSLSATARYTFSAVCDRCAKPFEAMREVPVLHTLVSRLNEEDTGEYIVVDNLRLDLDELVREDVLLDLPSKILCREDCQGLCPQCGADLNIARCNCKKAVDPRMAALLELLED